MGEAKIEALKKRKLVAPTSLTAFKVEKTEKFSAGDQKAVADLTAEMITKGTWSSTTFKPFNLTNASGVPSAGGHLHPLNKVKTEMRTVLMQMGFEEMPTNQWVESSFWNFDALFQPQQHPARDAHDTFFMEAPSRAQKIPEDYLGRVKEMHEKGGSGSIGWRYDWSEDEARKTLLRTHTTAVSARMLYKMGEEYRRTGVFRPKKYFSIDRVFRNETLDATHLAEFHQIEGFVADRNIGLPQLIGVLRDFFARIGISKLRFKPAYNPYTEPSMEIFGFHPILKKWIEVGNSGVFRPEMLLPMGLPEDVTVIAWGIGCERWTALLYNIRLIKELFSFQQDVAATKKNPMCWLRRAEDRHGSLGVRCCGEWLDKNRKTRINKARLGLFGTTCWLISRWMPLGFQPLGAETQTIRARAEAGMAWTLQMIARVWVFDPCTQGRSLGYVLE
ncbi:unnamed protein product [Durusdinium trenchii]|uniref:phenylalanine--tRNA ligase n=3 Tax=Durusdinium trenchii TaxID=1381693 RepID=A0ABP0K261_9DINO